MRLFENILSQTNSIYKENERKRLLFSIKSYILCQTRIIRTEAYRSGHNEAVLKTVWVHAHGGSNPSASARRKKYEPLRFVFLSFYVCQGIRTGWQAARNDCLNFSKKQADQTTDGTVVCNPGVIASVRKRK